LTVQIQKGRETKDHFGFRSEEMKLSKKERKLLKHEIQQGFMHAWLAESRTKERLLAANSKRRPERCPL